MSKLNPRKQRLSESKNFVGGPQASPELLASAHFLLQVADQESQQKLTVGKNRFSHHATATTVLYINAFDAWLNEQIDAAVLFRKRSTRFKLLMDTPGKDNLWEKYKAICKLAKTKASPLKKDIEILTKIRNEIVHYYPRQLKMSGYFKILKKFDLSLGDNISMYHGFNNYAVAHTIAWIIYGATKRLGKNLSIELMPGMNYDLSINFKPPL